jgi:anaerobic selenocysteine-containing dehydrogenase
MVTRRDFLKISAATGAGLATMRLQDFRFDFLEPLHAQATTGKIEYYPNYCLMCANTCGIRVAVKDLGGTKRIVKIEGNPKHPYNRGKLCPRGQAGLRRLYHPNRLKTPLIRAGGERGEWNFRAATWEEAGKYILRRLEEKDIKPYEIAVYAGWEVCVMYDPFVTFFPVAMETPNLHATPLQNCVTGSHFGLNTCIGTLKVQGQMMADYENARYILVVRNNASIAGISTGRARNFARGKRKGARVVVVDPRMSETAAMADEWIPIKPGTDLAFLLAVLNTIVSEELFDEKFTANHTNAPFLAYEEDGLVKLLAEKDEKGVKAYFVYDLARGEIRKVPAFTNTNERDVEGNKIETGLAVPEGTVFQGKKVKTVFQFLRDKIAEYTPAWASKICDVPAETIHRVAREFGAARPALIEPGWYDPRYENTMMTRRTAAIIMALVGGIDREGGWIFTGGFRGAAVANWKAGIMKLIGGWKKVFGNPKAPFWKAHGRPHVGRVWSDMERKKGRPGVVNALKSDVGLLDSIEGKLSYNGEEYRVKAMFIFASNPIRGGPDDTRWKKALKKLELVVVSDIMPSDTALYADVILPNRMYLEKYDPLGPKPAFDLVVPARVPGIEPISRDTKGTLDQLMWLAKTLNSWSYFKNKGKNLYETYVKILAKKIGADPKKMMAALQNAEAKGKTAHEALYMMGIKKFAKKFGKPEAEFRKILEEEGVFVAKRRDALLRVNAMPRKKPLPIPTGRAEVYSTLLAGIQAERGYRPNWDPIITYIPPKWKDGVGDTWKPTGNEFFFTSGKVPTMSHTSCSDIDLLMAISETKEDKFLYVWLNADTAKRLGITTGDRIEIENVLSGQKAVGTAYATELIRPDTIFVAAAFGAENKMQKIGYGKGVAMNKLTPYRNEPVVGAYRNCEFTVKVRRV